MTQLRQEASPGKPGDIAPTRPLLRWHGSKWRIAPWIISHFPAHKVYVEPFGGAGGVLLQKPRAVTEIYNDRDADVVNLFAVLRDRAQELERALALTPYSRDEYAACYEPSECPVERARRFVARSFMGMSSKGALQKSGFDARINDDGYCSRLSSFLATTADLPQLSARLRGVIIENLDVFDLIGRYDAKDALTYLDPPYLGSPQLYRHKFKEAEHRRLADAARAMKGFVAISGYDNPIYAETLSDWSRFEAKANVDGGASGKASERTEVLWINPPCAERLRSAGPLFEAAA